MLHRTLSVPEERLPNVQSVDGWHHDCSMKQRHSNPSPCSHPHEPNELAPHSSGGASRTMRRNSARSFYRDGHYVYLLTPGSDFREDRDRGIPYLLRSCELPKFGELEAMVVSKETLMVWVVQGSVSRHHGRGLL